MKKCLIVTGGKLDLAFARSFLQKESFQKIIAVDGGLEAVEALGLIPDYVVGDFDTVNPAVLERFRKIPYIVWEKHRPEKNETDTELACNRGMTLACDRIVFLGATGGRLDHMLGNIHVLYACLQRGVEAWLIDSQNKLYLLDQGKRFYQEELWGKYVSFLPYTEKVEGITLRGFRYPLNEKNIRKGEEAGLCISNELAEKEATIELAEGILICVESRD
ncbi:MAG: thiamine diphosphokinase [Lachnospiraceae bacterium]|nr:thiamine diphosphokinase [Lachnospiraceae bacterium]